MDITDPGVAFGGALEPSGAARGAAVLSGRSEHVLGAPTGFAR